MGGVTMGSDPIVTPGDNGAMVAGLAFYRRNVFGDAAFRADASPSLQVGLA